MSLHQVKLAPNKKRRAHVDEALLAQTKSGAISWTAALGERAIDVDALRAQGRALCLAGRFAEALDVLTAVTWLGDPDRHDALYVGFCHEGLGDFEKANACFAIARAYNDAIEAALGEVRR